MGARVHARPAVGDTVAVRVTVPANPLSAVRVTVEVAVTPARTVTLVGLVAITKSCTV